MYVLKLGYLVGETAKEINVTVNELYASIAEYGNTCRFTFGSDEQGDTFEAIVEAEGEITSLELYDENEATLYSSAFWNKLVSIQNTFPLEGAPIREVVLTHR